MTLGPDDRGEPLARGFVGALVAQGTVTAANLAVYEMHDAGALAAGVLNHAEYVPSLSMVMLRLFSMPNLNVKLVKVE
jgi:hypothetical protein